MKNAIFGMMSVLFFAALSFGCGPTHTLPDSQPLPQGMDFTGLWYSPQFEHMYLRQTGDEVRGIYTYKNGGTLGGTANGNLLEFVWIDPGEKESARRKIQGKGYLQLVKDGEQIILKGEWGYNDTMHGGGPWEAEWVRSLDGKDPRTLEEWRNQD